MSSDLFKWDSGKGESTVDGPASAVDGNLPVFDGTTGKLIKDSGVSLSSQAKNLVLAGPASGANAAPTFRALVQADLPVVWTSYTPTVTAQSGTITTYSASGKYRVIGKSCLCAVKITLTNVGTASGQLRASIPYANAGGFLFAGSGVINGLATGLTVWIPETWTDMNIVRSDGASIFVNGYDVYASIEYPIA